MRLIDMANAWSKGTHSQYQGKLSMIRNFEARHEFGILRPSRILQPPRSVDIALMWVHEAYSLRASLRSATRSTVSMATIRQLRSAASQYLGWEMMLANPSATILDPQNQVLGISCRPTDAYSFTLFTKGMSGRLGTESQPATPLLFRHVRYMDVLFCANYRAARNPATPTPNVVGL
jgi:hypothetical protein